MLTFEHKVVFHYFNTKFYYKWTRKETHNIYKRVYSYCIIYVISDILRLGRIFNF